MTIIWFVKVFETRLGNIIWKLEKYLLKYKINTTNEMLSICSLHDSRETGVEGLQNIIKMFRNII